MPVLDPSDENMAVANQIVNETRIAGYVTMKYAIAQELEKRDERIRELEAEMQHNISERLVSIHDYVSELKDVLECFRPFVMEEKYKVAAALCETVTLKVPVSLSNLEAIQKLLNGKRNK